MSIRLPSFPLNPDLRYSPSLKFPSSLKIYSRFSVFFLYVIILCRFVHHLAKKQLFRLRYCQLQKYKYLYEIERWCNQITFAGYWEGTGGSGGEQYHGLSQTACWSDIPRHIPVHRLWQNREERLKGNG